MSLRELTRVEVEQWLSSGRLSIYLGAAQGNVDQALRLYDWNARVTAACLQDLGHLEVLIRNQYASELSRLSPNWTSPVDPLWSTESGITRTRALQSRSNSFSQRALRKARPRTPFATHGQIIANLTFGFWTSLTQPERDATIWTPALSRLFQGAARGPVHDRMNTLNIFRNRLAHWEPVFSQTTGLMKQLKHVDELFTLLSPPVAAWVGERSTVARLIRTVPSPSVDAPPARYLGAVVAG